MYLLQQNNGKKLKKKVLKLLVLFSLKKAKLLRIVIFRIKYGSWQTKHFGCLLSNKYPPRLATNRYWATLRIPQIIVFDFIWVRFCFTIRICNLKSIGCVCYINSAA